MTNFLSAPRHYTAPHIRHLMRRLEEIDARHGAGGPGGLCYQLAATQSVFRRPEGLRARVAAWYAERDPVIEELREAREERRGRGLPEVA